ncbi:hypothetical protein J4E86_005104 [Alternaria arbusti]|uniref:uncharacterized protein n=1 Tax=Alternaria arbusti TaxID=232088 RepID=UPI00221EEF0E|nr:uncharacterized protein J4E86_005104 [Alternaria arbusti]KAI4957964.1 hypothetical protein J4E86_005104 [Alternaria arbusti]
MQNQQMAQMAQMNANGSLNGTPIMGNMAHPKRMGDQDPKEKLNTYIYDYFLRNRHHTLARAMLDCDLKLNTEKASPNNKPNGASDIDMPDDLPLPLMPPGQAADNSFLLDWWVQFWDIFAAARGGGGGPKNAAQYLGHNRNLGHIQNQQRDQRLMMATNPMNGAQYMMRNGAMTNGNQTDLKRAAAMNNRPAGNPMAGMQPMKNPNMIQMQRDGSNMDMNGNRPNSPGSNENAPSPNKRPRVDGGMNTGNMPSNQFNEFMPQGPGAQQKNIEVYAQSLAHQHRVAMSNTSSPQGMNSGVQGSPMAQSGLDGQDLTFAGNGPRPGNMPNNPPGAPQQGNHALQDYQMQLMLLEQQNKKRLLMARQEQDNQSGHPQQGVIGAPGFGAAMSPQGSRAGGPSPNPADQMKRGTPKLGQQNLPGSPMPEGMMGQQRASPAPNMNFDPSLAPPGMPPQFYPQNMSGPNGNPMMRPPSSHPQPPNFNGQQLTPAQMEAMRNGQMQQNGWRGPQPGMMGPGGQQMGGPMGQNPQQRQQMPPPPAPTNEPPRPEPSPSVSNQAPPTPNQGNKANPKKKVTKDNKKPANNKKGAAGSTPATTNGEEPPTPTSSTPVAPITPVHKQSFNQGQNGQPQPVQPQPPSDQNMDNGGPPFGNIDGDPNGFDLGLNFGDDAGALETFDFDSFLQTGNDNDAFGNLVSDFDFPNPTEV